MNDVLLFLATIAGLIIVIKLISKAARDEQARIDAMTPAEREDYVSRTAW